MSVNSDCILRQYSWDLIILNPDEINFFMTLSKSSLVICLMPLVPNFTSNSDRPSCLFNTLSKYFCVIILNISLLDVDVGIDADVDVDCLERDIDIFVMCYFRYRCIYNSTDYFIL